MKHFVMETTHLSRELSRTDFGWGNGYVLIPKGHPMHGVPYDNIPVDVHGGLTFAEKVNIDMVNSWGPLTKSDVGKWCVGFDTCHYSDTLEIWPKQRVEDETKSLKRQLVEMRDKA